MKKTMTKTLTDILLIGLVLGSVTLAHAQRSEVAVVSFHADVWFGDGTMNVNLYINGTGSISPGGALNVIGGVPGAEPGDTLATATAFAGLAQSLGCTTGEPSGYSDPNWESSSVTCVCDDLRNDLILVIGQLMKFPLTLSLDSLRTRPIGKQK